MSLKVDLARRLLHDVILTSRGTDKAVVLVVDPHTSKILSSCLRMYDIMEAGVIVLQNVTKKRERLDLPAIYFIEPTERIIKHLIADFTDIKKPQYDSIHLFFTNRIKPDLMKLISECRGLVKRIKTFVELNVDFISIESRIYSFAVSHSLPKLYFPPSTDILSSELSNISKHLVTLCLTMNEFPHVRFANNGKTGLSKALATFFEDDMKKTISKLPNWKASENRERGTLLIVDRSLDPVAPLMHEYTYQAMANDLVRMKGELCFLENPTPDEEEKKAEAAAAKKKSPEDDKANAAMVLSEDDELWVEFRHKHIGEVMHQISELFRSFKGQNKLAKLQTDADASVKDMLQAMKEMPEYRSMMRKYHKHMTLAQECMGKYDNRKLKEIGELEQDMATGLTSEGKSIQSKTIVAQLIKLCEDPVVGILDKLRLLMIYIISQGGIQDATRQRLMKDIHLSLQKSVRNLEKLGVDLTTMKSNKSKHSKERLAEFTKRNKTIPMALMRYLPQLHSVLEQLVSGELDEEKYPYMSPPPPNERQALANKGGKSARKKQGEWAGGEKKDEKEEDTRPRFITFMLGGLTFSEMRSVYEISEQQKAQVFCGSTSILTAREFIRDLSDLSRIEFREAIKQSKPAGAPDNGEEDFNDEDDDDQGEITDEDFNKLSINFEDKK